MSSTDEKLQEIVNVFLTGLKQAMTEGRQTKDTVTIVTEEQQNSEQKPVIRLLSPSEVQQAEEQKRQQPKSRRAITPEEAQNYQEETLCDPEKIDQRLETMEADCVWKKTIQSLKEPKKLEKISTNAEYERIEQELTFLALEHPNFAEPTMHIASMVRLRALRKSYFNFKPMLVYGPPGSGKSRWVRKLCELLRLHRIAIDLSGSCDFLKVTGNSRGWKNAGPGEIVKGIAASENANPIIVLDEIDKTYINTQGNPLDRLLMLTEKETAIEFMDDYVEVPMNTSYCSIIAMANSLEPLPAPFLSRFSCYEIKHLDLDGRKIMAQIVYSELLQEENVRGLLTDTLNKEVINQLANSQLEGRALKSAIRKAIFRACEEIPMGDSEHTNVNSVTTKHLELTVRSVKNSIGFIR